MRRTWIKLYVDQCLRGSMISELTAEQRWLWIGLLLLAGDSMVPGVIFRRKDADGKLMGYSSTTLSEMLDVNILVYEDGISRMISKNKISIDILGVISIVNWDKYQSEYQRQKKYRHGDKVECNQSIDIEREGEREREEDNTQATTTKRSLRKVICYPEPFRKYWGAYPIEGRFHKEASSQKFGSLLRNGTELAELEEGLIGYLNHLKHERVYNKFEKHPMHLLTFLSKDRFKTYIGFKYEPPL